LVGANPSHDQNLLRILYALAAIKDDQRYSDAADNELQWFFEHAWWPQTGLRAWGEHANWDVMQDKPASRCREPHHEMGRPWMLWDRSFKLAPKACAEYATAIWKHQIADHETGDFDRHADPHQHNPADDYDLPRHAGMYILAWANAYEHTRDKKFLHYIDVMLRHFEHKRDPKTGLLPAWGNSLVAWPLSSMSMVLDCHASASSLPDSFTQRIRDFGAAEDKAFLALDHDPSERGFVVSAIRNNGKAAERIGPHTIQARTVVWGGKGGEATTAMVGLLCVARNEQAPCDEYRKLIVETADVYLNKQPPEDHDTWPLAMSQAITMELAGYKVSGEKKYLDWARKLARQAVEIYWQNNPLPKASVKTDHYETLTGADSLALSLLEVATVDTPAAEHVPSNTIDR
jgi:hypothetical protein